jgi:hypothetical protein
MSETKQQTDAAIATLKTIAEILPAAMLSTDDVQILKTFTAGQMERKALIDALGVDPDQLKKDKGLTKAFDKDGNQLFGRGVEKVNLNVRMDKPLIEVLNSYCEATGLTKTDVLRQIIFTHLYSANLARQADVAEGEPTTDAED